MTQGVDRSGRPGGVEDPARASTEPRFVITGARCVPGMLNRLSNKLSASASALYLERFGMGVLEWRVMVAIAAEPGVSGHRISQIFGLDKATVSRGISRLDHAGYLEWSGSGRQRCPALSPSGWRLYDRIVPIALERERQLLQGLSAEEHDLLIDLLHRLLANLPRVNAYVPPPEPGE